MGHLLEDINGIIIIIIIIISSGNLTTGHLFEDANWTIYWRTIN